MRFIVVVTSRNQSNNTTAMAAMIMRNCHMKATKLMQHIYSNSRNENLEGPTKTHATHTMATAAMIMRNSHEGHQTHTTHYGNGRNDCAES